MLILAGLVDLGQPLAIEAYRASAVTDPPSESTIVVVGEAAPQRHATAQLDKVSLGMGIDNSSQLYGSRQQSPAQQPGNEHCAFP